ncbi:MAG TPA: hydroxymethylglutaryl-CoA lyase [Acidimicrobiales bacterium]|nr:hydroxymethylglutaryl-CoA lyase [Acidimicrobiales bacterium]
MRPSAVRMAGLPERVTVYEVGPRDGLQNEPVLVPLETKLQLISRLVAAGLKAVEVTSLVRPDAVPQLADAEQLLARLPEGRGVRYSVLVPNRRGLDRALALGVRKIALFASATESFAQRNLNRSRAESMRIFGDVAARAKEEGLAVRGYVSMCFGDPWEGDVDPAQVVGVATELMAMGCQEVSIGDTIGVATPGAVSAMLSRMVDAGVRLPALAVHFHDTYGQALSNTLEALHCGITTVDASAGGLGGCPFAHSATGNLATEDLVFQLDGLGVMTGVDLTALARTSLWLAEQLGRPSPSRTVQALAQTLGPRSDRPYRDGCSGEGPEGTGPGSEGAGPRGVGREGTGEKRTSSGRRQQ